MIPIRPKLKIAFNGTVTTFTSTLSPSGINVSKTFQTMLDGDYSPINKGFQLSPSISNVLSPLNGTYSPFDDNGYNGFISKIYTLPVVFEMQVSGEAPLFLRLIFDPIANEYATSFSIENTSVSPSTIVTVTDNDKTDVTVDISSLNVSVNNVLRLSILAWSKDDISIKLSHITTYDEYVANGSQLISFTCSQNMMDSNLSINPGICEQYADIELYDKGGVLTKKGLAGELHKDQVVMLYAIDDNEWAGTNNEVVLGDYLTEEWSIENNNSIVKLSCRDASYRLDKINVPRANIEDRTLDDIIVKVFSEAPQYVWNYMDEDTKTRCQQIVIPNSWYYANDLETILNNICQVGMLRIYYFNKTFLIGRCA